MGFPTKIFYRMFSGTFSNFFQNFRIFYKKYNLFNNYVVSRGLYALAIPVDVIAGVADLILAIPLSIGSLVTFGSKPWMNSHSIIQLKSLAFVDDVSKHFRLMFNPSREI